MKLSRLLFLLSILMVSSLELRAQVNADTEKSTLENHQKGINMISCSDYNAIKYNGYTIQEINEVDGDFSLLWENPSAKASTASWSRTFKFYNNKVSYNSEFDYVQGISILDTQWKLEILGKEVRVEDSFSELNQKFTDELKIIYKPDISNRYVVSFSCADNNYDGLLIYFNPDTHKIDEIKYFVNP